MGLFAQVKDAKAYSKHPYFLPGNYTVEIEKAKKESSARKKGTELVAVEVLILKSDNPERKAGTRMAQVWMGDNEATPGNIKTFVLACYPEMTEAGMDEAGLETIFGPDNPLKGMVMDVQAYNKDIANKQKPGETKVFTVVNWSQPKDGTVAVTPETAEAQTA